MTEPTDTYMDQSRRDEMLTAHLPAWAWRMVVYCMESHIDYRHSVGHDDVATNYEHVHERLCAELGVSSSGDLPTATNQTKSAATPDTGEDGA